MKKQEQMKKLVEKANKEWGKNWTIGMMRYEEEDNIIMVYTGEESDEYKVWFDADTLEFQGSKC